jgi:hypothetical protein
MSHEEQIRAAIRAYTDWVQNNMGFPAHDCVPSPTVPDANEGLDDWKAAVLKVCDKMKSLADDPKSTMKDFEILRHSVKNFPVTVEQLGPIADAFRDAGRLDPE